VDYITLQQLKIIWVIKTAAADVQEQLQLQHTLKNRLWPARGPGETSRAAASTELLWRTMTLGRDENKPQSDIQTPTTNSAENCTCVQCTAGLLRVLTVTLMLTT
jgi:hypothetical protein